MAAAGCRRPAPASDRAGVLERLPAASMGYWRLPGALVRGLSGPEPLHRVRPLSALRRGLELLDQPRRPVAGNAVAITAHAARAGVDADVSLRRDQPAPDPVDRAAVARQHAADRHLRGAVG